jgi:hypothetical protein
MIVDDNIVAIAMANGTRIANTQRPPRMVVLSDGAITLSKLEEQKRKREQ